MYSVIDIANWFLQKEPMTHKKIQKICYYAYAWHFALKNKELCNDAEFEAWVHGPVSRKLYDKYKGRGWETHTLESSPPMIDRDTEEVLDRVWDTYGNQTGTALEALTHTELPWKKARVGLEPLKNSNKVIDKNDMKSFYLSIYKGGEE